MSFTKQQTFDATVAHARRQRRRSFRFDKETGRNICFYRDTEGGACFVGCHIPDEDYYPNLENKCVNHNMVSSILVDKLGHDLDLLQALQYIHDSSSFDEALFIWEKKFEKTAADFGLKYSPPEVEE